MSGCLQELLRIPVRHPKLLGPLKADDPKRAGVANLAAFNDRLWVMTGMPLRYFQEVALWLFQHTAALELQDNVQRSGVLAAASLCQKLELSAAQMLSRDVSAALTPPKYPCPDHTGGVSATQAWFEQHVELASTSTAEESAAFLRIPANVTIPRIGSSLEEVRTWLRVRAYINVTICALIASWRPLHHAMRTPEAPDTRFDPCAGSGLAGQLGMLGNITRGDQT